MESKKLSSTITTKPAADASGKGKSIVVDEERANMVKGGRLPSLMQSRTVLNEEEKREQEVVRKKAEQEKLMLISSNKLKR